MSSNSREKNPLLENQGEGKCQFGLQPVVTSSIVPTKQNKHKKEKKKESKEDKHTRETEPGLLCLHPQCKKRSVKKAQSTTSYVFPPSTL